MAVITTPRKCLLPLTRLRYSFTFKKKVLGYILLPLGPWASGQAGSVCEMKAFGELYCPTPVAQPWGQKTLSFPIVAHQEKGRKGKGCVLGEGKSAFQCILPDAVLRNLTVPI